MKKVVITGAHSFIGSYFAKASPDDEVTEFDLEHESLDQLSFMGQDVVFHVAAIVHQDASISDALYYHVNRDLAVSVARKAKADGVKQFVFMSTVKVYGENSTVVHPWTEESPCHPQDAYGKSKLEAETLLQALQDNDFRVMIVRTPVVYGEGVKGNIQRMAQMMHKVRVVPLGGIDNKRAMIYIGNLVYIIKKGMDKQFSGIVLAAEGQGYSTSEFVKYLANNASKRIIVLYLPQFVISLTKKLRPSLHQRLFGSMVLDNSRSQDKLDLSLPYTPDFGFKEVMKSL